jgi:lantibiotic leader peptide-processing serine protease
MHRRNTVLALFAAVAIAGCSIDVAVAPKAPTAPKFAVSAGEGSGNYIVLMKGNADEFGTRVASLGGTVTYSHAPTGFALVSGLSNAAADELSSSGFGQVEQDVEVALPTQLASAEAEVSEVGDPSVNSQANPATASRFVWQWNMRLIQADAAWAATPAILGDPGVTVAILDTGIDYDAPDLTGLVDLTRSASFMNVYVRPASEAPTNPPKLSDDLVTSRHFPTRHPISDYNGHGTNVATQVSSKAAALAGVTSRTTLIGVKVLGSNGRGSLGSVLGGVLWAADHGADVANMSLGGGFSKSGAGQTVSIINRVFNYAKQQGMLIVVSAGNAGADLQHNGNQYSSYCDAPHVVCVSSVGPATGLLVPDAAAYYTNFGRQALSVAAPGGNADAAHGFPASARPWGADIASWVWSFCSKTRIGSWTIPALVTPPAPQPPAVPNLTACVSGNRLTGYIGTSQAAPHVAGLAALLVAKHGHGQPQNIKHLLEQSGDPIDPALGGSRINVKNALGL